MSGGGWGSGGWGTSPWGSGEATELQLIGAQPVRENVIRLEFNAPPLFTGILDPNDASDPERYSVVPITGSLLGSDPRNVDPILAELAEFASAAGRFVDVTVDRPMSPWPAQYLVSVNQLRATGGELLDPAKTSLEVDGSLQKPIQPRRDLAVPVRDIANPQTREALFDPLPQTSEVAILGTIPVDENGDYAVDEGITSYKKRVLRRLSSRKNGFAFLVGYGLGAVEQLKKLGSATLQAELANEAEIQVAREPETEAVSATIVPDPVKPGLFRLRIRAKAKISSEPIDINVPFSPTGS